MIVILAVGLSFMAAGVLWKGQVRRPFLPRRARKVKERRLPRDLRRSADMAIAAARRAAARDEPAIIRVDDVLTLAAEHFGHEAVDRDAAAGALRERYEWNRCQGDCVTDAYDVGKAG
ncbi:hypothetical protein OG875_17710 [Streptomyces sp. NBC_01498]|uniref:hypothetical protein n=1 Tax=Streptomyces sp. NBC_01498 TaxID=2975870 RepID=UPI002E7AEED7|nr:hypothetical protein [Streptomyces sp. NBC_01498]WTL26258.1 hypothetical protein OG875_17710 [Streptomyces sp. NBC_01498]